MLVWGVPAALVVTVPDLAAEPSATPPLSKCAPYRQYHSGWTAIRVPGETLPVLQQLAGVAGAPDGHESGGSTSA